MAPPGPRYSKQRRQIVIALDVGTTFSGASYSIIEPGEKPVIKGVTSYRGQEHLGGDSKIPSIVVYNEKGVVVAVGPQVNLQKKIDETRSEVDSSAGEEYSTVTWFKLHLRPKHLSLPHEIPPIPDDRNPVEVFADFLKYLYGSVLHDIGRKHFNGNDIVASLKEGLHFILTHPNGWGGSEQARIRKAAIRAGLVDNFKDAEARLCFLTEGEAAVHYCIRQNLATNFFNTGMTEGIMVIDAGGGTIDISAYTRDTNTPHPGIHLKEIVASRCIFQGSIFVTERARLYLAEALRSSPRLADIDIIVDAFDRTTKCWFQHDKVSEFIQYRGNVRTGQIKIPGDKVAGFFEPSINAIVEAVQELCTESETNTGVQIRQAFLVGGFAWSNYLYNQLKIHLNREGVELACPDERRNKAVADGAISYYLDRFVNTRISKYTYGVYCYERYDAADPGHRRHASASPGSVFRNSDGKIYLQNIFDPILRKGEQVQEMKEFRASFFRQAETISEFDDPMIDEIIMYRGSRENPKWKDSESEMYEVLCTVKSDVTQLLKYLPPSIGTLGRYYHLKYDVILSFGLTELKAEVEIRYNAKRKRETVKRFAAEIVYHDEDESEGADMYAD